MNQKPKLPPSAIELSEQLDRASARAFNKEQGKPYDQALEEPEPARPRFDHLLPAAKSDEQFLAELEQEVDARDERARRDGAAVVAAAELTLVHHNSPGDPRETENVTNQWVDGTPTHLDAATVSKITEGAQTIPDPTGEVPQTPHQDVA